MNQRRDASKERHWRGLIEKQGRSGVTARQFCHDEGLDESSFYHWRRELRLRALERSHATKPCAGLEPNSVVQRGVPSRNGNPDSTGFSEAPMFMPIRVMEDRAPHLEIVFECGTTLRIPPGFDVETLRGVLEALERARC